MTATQHAVRHLELALTMARYTGNAAVITCLELTLADVRQWFANKEDKQHA